MYVRRFHAEGEITVVPWMMEMNKERVKSNIESAVCRFHEKRRREECAIASAALLRETLE